VRPLQLDAVARGGRRTCGAAVTNLQGVGNSTLYSPLKTTMTSGQDVSDFLDTWVWLNHILSFLGEKNREKKDFFLWCSGRPRGAGDFPV
jgi:hypothetical protein